MLFQRRFTPGDDHPVQKAISPLQKGEEIPVAHSGSVIPAGYEIGVVAIRTPEIAAGKEADAAYFSGEVDEGMLLKTAEEHIEQLIVIG
jgi:hypothetical protein